MATLSGYMLSYGTQLASGAGSANRFLTGLAISTGSGAPPIVDYFKMIGIASGNLVAWVVTGSPDITGASYGGSGVLDLATISVSDTWQV